MLNPIIPFGKEWMIFSFWKMQVLSSDKGSLEN